MWAMAADKRSHTSAPTLSASPFTHINAVVTSTASVTPEKTIEDLHNLMELFRETMAQQQLMFSEINKTCIAASTTNGPTPKNQISYAPSYLSTQNTPTAMLNKQYTHPRPQSARDWSITCSFCYRQGHATEACHRKYEKECRDNGWEIEPLAPRTVYQRRDRFPTTGYFKQDNRTSGHQVTQSTGAVAPGTQGNW